MNHRDKTFRNQTLLLDGNSFHGCRFEKCRLAYAGGKFKFENNSFDDIPTVIFRGSALNTLNFLVKGYNSNVFGPTIKNTLENIREGRIALAADDPDPGSVN